jgi:hypothetical protein
MSYRITGLDPRPFAHLHGLDDEALAAHGARRYVADAKPGFPCRITLEDAEPGERLVLVNFVHQPADSPFRASHAIYVRETALQAALYDDEIPPAFLTRTLSVRAFDEAGMMVDAELVAGSVSDGTIRRMLDDRNVAYLHVHFAKPGCFAASVTRVA